VKASAENAPSTRDLLVPPRCPSRMKAGANPAVGTVIAKRCILESGTGVIQILVMLQ